MPTDKEILDKIFSPSIKMKLNPKNRNHWIALFRKEAIENYKVKQEDAKNWFTNETIGHYFDNGFNPIEAVEDCKIEWNDVNKKQ